MATDLSKLRQQPRTEPPTVLPPRVAEAAQRQAEYAAGLRCRGCGKRVTTGFRFMQVGVVVVEGEPEAVVAQEVACNGDSGCDFAAQLRQGATCVEMVELVWLDGGVPEADDEPAEEPRKPSRAKRAAAKRRAGG